MNPVNETDVSKLSVGELESLLHEKKVRPSVLVRELRERASRQYGTDASLALSAAEKAMDLGRASGDDVALGWGYRSLAEAWFFSGRYNEAEAHFQLAIESWTDTEESERCGELYTALVHVLTLLGRYDEALAAARQARPSLERAGNLEYQAKLAMNLGTLHFQRDDHPAALEACRTATNLFDEMGRSDPTAIGAKINLAVALTQVERPNEALRVFREANRICEESGFTLLLAQGRMNEAFVLQQMGEFGDALKLLSQAYDYFDEADHIAFRSSTVLSRGETYHELNLHDESGRMAEEAVSGFASEGMRYYEATARYQLALSELARELPEEAQEQVELAAELFRHEDNTPRALLCDLLLAETLLRRGDASRAATRAETVLRGFRRLRLLRWEATTASLLGRAALEMGPTPGMARRLRGVLRRVDAKVYPGTALRLQDTLAEVQLALGQRRAAARTNDAAARTLESIRFRVPGEEAKLSFLQDKAHVFDRRIELEASSPRPRIHSLFDLMERGRAQRAWDSFHTLAEGAGSDPALKSTRERLSWAHSRAARLELGSEVERKTAVALQEEIVQLETDLNRRLRAQKERQWQGTRDVSADEVDLDAVAAALPKECGLVTFHLSDGLAYAIVLEGTAGRSRFVRLDDTAKLEVQRLADELDFQWRAAALENASRIHSQRKSDSSHVQPGRTAAAPTGAHHFPAGHPMVRATHEVLRQLHQALWAPLDVDPNVTTWHIAAHGPAHRIPFPALFDGQHFLVDQAAVSMIPSARVWLQTHLHAAKPDAQRARSSRRAWVGGLPLPELPYVEEELNAIASLIGSDAPESTAPGATVPGYGTTGTAVPESATPGYGTRGSTVPESATPGSATPRSAAPESTVPESATPGSATPRSAAPESGLPPLDSPHSEPLRSESLPWKVELDVAPTRETVLKRGRECGLIHLATHGRLRRNNPAYSSLQMADGPLFVHDLEGADFSGVTVVLTACSSGRGKQVVADEWIGLGNGFLHAGAVNIVTSLWEIEDEASATFASGFYRSLRAGEDPVRSHRQGLMAVRNQFAHPWHWAPYTSMGGVAPRRAAAPK